MDRPNSEQQPACEASTHNQGSPEEHTSLRRLPGALQRHWADSVWDLALCGLEILCLPEPQAALQTVSPSCLESCPAHCCIGRLSSDEVQCFTISGIYCSLRMPKIFCLAAFSDIGHAADGWTKGGMHKASTCGSCLCQSCSPLAPAPGLLHRRLPTHSMLSGGRCRYVPFHLS
jgi:hypothetical protein